MPRCTKGTRSGKKDAKDTAPRIKGGEGSMGTRKELTLLDSLRQSSFVNKLSHDGKGIWCAVGRGGGRHDDWDDGQKCARIISVVRAEMRISASFEIICISSTSA